MLYTLGRSFAYRYRPLIESFLESDDDPMLARLAIQILGQMWGEAGNYLDQVKRFLYGVPWDKENGYFVRQMAISVSGSYLENNSEAQLLGELIRIFEDDNEESILRGDAYLALGRAMGRERKELPSPARRFDLDKQTDPSVLEEAKSRLAREPRKG